MIGSNAHVIRAWQGGSGLKSSMKLPNLKMRSSCGGEGVMAVEENVKCEMGNGRGSWKCDSGILGQLVMRWKASRGLGGFTASNLNGGQYWRVRLGLEGERSHRCRESNESSSETERDRARDWEGIG
jgi:hypothetical protein